MTNLESCQWSNCELDFLAHIDHNLSCGSRESSFGNGQTRLSLEIADLSQGEHSWRKLFKIKTNVHWFPRSKYFTWTIACFDSSVLVVVLTFLAFVARVVRVCSTYVAVSFRLFWLVFVVLWCVVAGVWAFRAGENFDDVRMILGAWALSGERSNSFQLLMQLPCNGSLSCVSWTSFSSRHSVCKNSQVKKILNSPSETTNSGTIRQQRRVKSETSWLFYTWIHFSCIRIFFLSLFTSIRHKANTYSSECDSKYESW